ncbi:hypothetical protein NCF85_12900 [Qipengyuania citrea]|uniref:Uncharacterized protein n=1 Tax=Qipengyuania citrea TaxID=225971 RepID=A0ABY4U4E7_9SPHN|nr:hypothetical protein [Qipengyuania citrea]USA60970.1 hypothetical protein NCF85_12900 [Qipengyuania citrea]
MIGSTVGSGIQVPRDRVAMRMSKLLAKTIDALANGCFHHPVALRGPSYLFIIPL